MNPAPADTLTFFTVTVKPSGAPGFVGSSVKLYCVLAMQTGSPPKPSEVSSSICFFAAGRTLIPAPPYILLTTVAILSSIYPSRL